MRICMDDVHACYILNIQSPGNLQVLWQVGRLKCTDPPVVPARCGFEKHKVKHYNTWIAKYPAEGPGAAACKDSSEAGAMVLIP